MARREASQSRSAERGWKDAPFRCRLAGQNPEAVRVDEKEAPLRHSVDDLQSKVESKVQVQPRQRTVAAAAPPRGPGRELRQSAGQHAAVWTSGSATTLTTLSFQRVLLLVVVVDAIHTLSRSPPASTLVPLCLYIVVCLYRFLYLSLTK
eukprot:GHVU01011605.1.p1 GENE.GHVU01011605.1~~GHVU01011605.1.p1  ORF type:complete len:150 (-),score=9.16 GHVU01011605.1:1386-1835(-)